MKLWRDQMIVTLTGSSGVGKTTITRELLKSLPNSKMLSSYTTRQSRNSDLPEEYKYISSAEFDKFNQNKFFMWTVDIHGTYYGTSLESIDGISNNEVAIYFMLLTPSVIAILRSEADRRKIKVLSFYIISPGETILRDRLKMRGDREDNIEKRVSGCLEWDLKATNSRIPYLFVKNDGDLNSSVQEMLYHIKSAI